MIDSQIQQLQEFIIRYNYILLFFALIAETSPLGLIIPGTIAIVLSGYFAGTGDLHIAGVIIAGIGGVFIGDLLSFGLGKFGWVKSRFVKKHIGRLSMVTDKINERRNLIIFSHFPGYTRMFVPLLLGGSRFRFNSWVWRDGLGAILFVSFYSIIGYTIGSISKSLNMAVTISKILPVVFILILLVWIVLGYIKYKRTKLSS